MAFCIYHGGCVDGLAAAAIVQRALGDQVEFYPGSYGKEPPSVAGKDVYIVDFSYKRDDLLKMLAEANKLIILDHHKTAQADLANISDPKAQIIFDMGRSGAGITWDYFYPGEPRPDIITYIEDRDLWRFAYSASKPIHYVLSLLPNDVNSWSQIFDWDIASKKIQGEAIGEYFAGKVIELRDLSFKAEIGGIIVPVCNAPYFFASELAGMMAEGNPFAGVFSTNGKDEFWSLRSRGDGMDVSEIARKYGGGGHLNAAGFKVPAGTFFKTFPI